MSAYIWFSHLMQSVQILSVEACSLKQLCSVLLLSHVTVLVEIITQNLSHPLGLPISKDQHGALGFWPCWGGCSFHATGCQRVGAHGIQTDKTRQGEGAGTNVHFEKTHNEHTVASLATLSLTQQLNASLYLAPRLCRLSIAPLRQFSVTLEQWNINISCWVQSTTLP